jgi:hypothetical protein
MPAAPFVGAVTTRPPAAFSSLTASANAPSHSPGARARPPRRFQLFADRARTTLHAGCRGARRRRAARVDARRHGVPDRVEPGGDLLGTQRLLVAAGGLGDREPVLVAQGEQLGGGGELQGERRGGDLDVGASRRMNPPIE